GETFFPITRCRLMSLRVSIALLGVLAAVTSTACAPAVVTIDGAPEAPRRVRAVAPDETATAYYRYSVAQMLAQGGRFKEAVTELQTALKDDPSSAFLWTQLAQWLVRADASPAEAIGAARKAVELAPNQPAGHLTLAELLRTQKQYAEAERELERVIEL